MDTRNRIVAAAAEVMRTRGLVRATTKEIARAAGFSEATLYKHFQDKTDLFLAVLGESGPADFAPVLRALPGRVGKEPVEDVLRDVVLAAAGFYAQGFPMAASIFSDPALLAAHITAVRARDAGPQYVSLAVAAYLEAEQSQGRVRADTDVEGAASLLIGACLDRAFLSHFVEDQRPVEAFAESIIGALINGLRP